MKKRLLPILIVLLMLISLGSNITYAEASVGKSIIKSEVTSTTTVNKKNIVVFFKFKGQDDTVFDKIGGIESLSKIFNTSIYGLKNYIYQVSDGQVNVNSTFYPLDQNGNVKVVELSNPLEYYQKKYSANPIGYDGTNKSERRNELHNDMINSLGASFEQDTNSINEDYTLSVMLPEREGWGDVLWSYKISLEINGTYHKTTVVANPEGNITDVINHEYMHILNFADQYSYVTHSYGYVGPVSGWSIMGTGGSQPTMYEKLKYTDWIYNSNCIQDITKSGRYSISPVGSGQDKVLAYKIHLQNKLNTDDEYFMVEYRDNTNDNTVDRQLAEGGLIVYRINPKAVNGNTYGPPNEIEVINEKKALDGGPGEIEFSDFKLSDGTENLGIKLSDIRIEDRKLYFNADLDWNKKTTIYYKGYTTPYIHYKVGSGVWTTVPGLAMTSDSKLPGYTNKGSVDLGSQSTLTACFNNGSGTWDSNKGANYTFGPGNYSYSNGVITKLEDLKISEFTSDIPNETTMGKSIKLNITSINGIGETKYKVTSIDSCSNTEVIEDYNTAKAVTWKPKKAEKYKLIVEAKDEEGNVDIKTMDYVINNVPSVNSTSFDKASAIQVGTSLNLSVTTTGGTGTSTCKLIAKGGNYQYGSKDIYFSMADAMSGTWTPDMDGEYIIVADITDQAGIVNRCVVGNYMVNKAKVLPLEVKGFGIDKKSVLLGDTVKINFNVSGGNSGNRYKIYAKDSKNVTTSIISNSIKNTVSWKPASAGDWTLYAIATDSQGNTVKTSILISVDRATTDVFKISSFVTNIANSTTLGKTIRISGNSINNSGTVLYKISARDSSGKVKVLKDYSEDKFVKWKPTKTGNYSLILEAKDGAGSVAKKYLQYFINSAPTIVDVNFSGNSPQDTGTAINLYVTTTGGTGNSTCKFVAVSGTKEVRFNMTSSNLGTWTPDTDGEYIIYADVTDGAGITKRNLVGTYIINKAPITPLEITSVTIDKTEMKVGDTLNFKINAKGGSGDYKYTVIFKIPNEIFSTVRVLDKSSSNSGSWIPTIAEYWFIDIIVTDSLGNYQEILREVYVN